MSGSGITVEHSGGILAVGFDRAQKRNALTAAMYEAMAQALADAEADDEVRVVLFHGSREVFTAGNDIEDFIQRPPSGEDAPVFRFLMSVARGTRPLVAAVNGPAIGLGTTLLLHCDLVFAAQDARFSMPFTQLGVVPEFGSSYLLPLVAGYQRAAELLLLGESFDAEKARDAGFVTSVLPPDQVLDAAWTAAQKIARLPKQPVRIARGLMKAAHREAVERALLAEGKHFRELLRQPAAR